MVIMLCYNDVHFEQDGFQTLKAGQEEICLHRDLNDILKLTLMV
jgi:hypothetical protein